MRIPDGDLVPARRRAYRGGYGSHRGRRRVLRRVALVVLLLIVAAAVVWFVARDDASAPRAADCPTPAACVAMRGEVMM